jgi:hypothetical protein
VNGPARTELALTSLTLGRIRTEDAAYHCQSELFGFKMLVLFELSQAKIKSIKQKQQLSADCAYEAFVSRMMMCSKCQKECPSLNQNTLQHLPATLVREEFEGLLDPETFADDGNTVLSAELVQVAMSFSMRGAPLSAVSEYFNSSLTKKNVETMEMWWYDNAVYRACLTDLVGDATWEMLGPKDRQDLAAERAEFIQKVRGVEVEDITDQVFADATLGDTQSVLLALALHVDSCRPLYRRFMDSICDSGSITGISLDWTHLSAKHIGDGETEKWLLTVVDQQQRLIAAWFTANTALESAEPLLQQLKQNGCCPAIIALDNLPPSINRDTGMVVFLKGIFDSCKQVCQDRFRVINNFQKDFGNKEDMHFHQDITMCVRRSMRYMHHGKKEQVIKLLKTKQLSVSTFFHGSWYTCDHRQMDDSEIAL